MNNKKELLEIATLAGGCFWCAESDYEHYRGVKTVVAGYTGGHKINPSYEEVCSGHTGHLEAVQITFDPGIIHYEQLLAIFWRHIDPTDPGGQFVDRGAQYRSAIFYHNTTQKILAQQSKRKLDASGLFSRPVVTEIIPFESFYPAEDYHQDYYIKNPLRYRMYRRNSGRDQFLRAVWQDEDPLLKLLRRHDRTEDLMNR